MGNYFAVPTNPQSWNMYSYVMSNPLNLTDPTGMDCIYLNKTGDGIDHVLSGGNPDCTSDKDPIGNAHLGQCTGVDCFGRKCTCSESEDRRCLRMAAHRSGIPLAH